MQWTILFLLLLAGCKNSGDNATQPDATSSEPSDVPGLSQAQNQRISIDPPVIVTDSGLMVFWESEFDFETFYNPPTRDDIEQWWVEIQQCTGMEAGPPVVYLVDDVVDFCPTREGTNAVHCAVEGNSNVYIQVNGSRIRRNWKHEFQHHLAWANDMEYYNHEPDWWWQCEWN